MSATVAVTHAAQPDNETWVFSLSNLKLARGDEKTELPLPADAPLGSKPGFVINRIPLSVEGRAWTLVDLMAGQKPLPRTDTEGKALISGQLSTAVREGDSDVTLEPVADTIAMLISFATCRDVAAFQCSRVSQEGMNLGFKLRSTKVHLYSEGGSALIDNSDSGGIRLFLERAYPTMQGNLHWWLASLDMFIQARMDAFVELRSALLNILLDRIAAFYPENRKGGEIDGLSLEELSKKPFKGKLTALMTEVCPKWSAELTNRYIVSYLTNCDARPSFASGIQRVCRANRLQPPTGAFLGTRHKLLHEGELKPEDGNTIAYMKELDWLVARLMMRMLDYEGNYFHNFNGGMRKLKDEFVT